MSNRENNNEQENKNGTKPDPETLHTTDPEKNMEGPVSSSTRQLGKPFDTDESKEEADKRRDEKM